LTQDDGASIRSPVASAVLSPWITTTSQRATIADASAATMAPEAVSPAACLMKKTTVFVRDGPTSKYVGKGAATLSLCTSPFVSATVLPPASQAPQGLCVPSAADTRSAAALSPLTSMPPERNAVRPSTSPSSMLRTTAASAWSSQVGLGEP